MKRIFLLSITLVIGLCAQVLAQKGNNELQVGAQLSFPTGQLADLTKTPGYGFSAKTLFGVGQIPQQLSFEVGYNRFGVKNSLLPANVKAQYRSWPTYLGYRYHLSKLYFESQAGAAFNTLYASNNFLLASDTKVYFAWALTAGYSIGDLDLALKYQSSDVANDGTNLTFIGVRVAYRFQFNKKTQF
jgi:hypothetical protein